MVLEGSKPGTRTSGSRDLQLIKMSRVPDGLKALTTVALQANRGWVQYGQGITPQMRQDEAQRQADRRVLDRMRQDPAYRQQILSDPIWGPHITRNYWI